MGVVLLIIIDKGVLLIFLADLEVILTNLSIARCLKIPHASSVILGASQLSLLEDNLNAIDVIPFLTEEVMANIDSIVDNRPAEIERF
jgi:aryl-alcohol dehydrogenase-like predicted oxidoreductase